MSTPMAVLGMVPVEVSSEQKTNPNTWQWKPQVKDESRLKEATMSSDNTSRNTFTSQVDHGEGK